MSKVIKILGFIMAGVMSWFNPVQVGMCCVSCAIKKEDDDVKIEYVEEVNKNN